MANIHQAEGSMRANDVERDHTEDRIISISPIRRDVKDFSVRLQSYAKDPLHCWQGHHGASRATFTFNAVS